MPKDKLVKHPQRLISFKYSFLRTTYSDNAGLCFYKEFHVLSKSKQYYLNDQYGSCKSLIASHHKIITFFLLLRTIRKVSLLLQDHLQTQLSMISGWWFGSRNQVLLLWLPKWWKSQRYILTKASCLFCVYTEFFHYWYSIQRHLYKGSDCVAWSCGTLLSTPPWCW